MLARALVRSPQLLILDEATSGLDAETERTIFERLKALSRDLALVVVTHNHRLQSYADRVLVMQEGSVKEMS